MTPPDFRKYATDSVTTIYPAWTSEPPTEAGWYWYNAPGFTDAVTAVRVCGVKSAVGDSVLAGLLTWHGSDGLARVEWKDVGVMSALPDARWYGPINPPTMEDTP